MFRAATARRLRGTSPSSRAASSIERCPLSTNARACSSVFELIRPARLAAIRAIWVGGLGRATAPNSLVLFYFSVPRLFRASRTFAQEAKPQGSAPAQSPKAGGRPAYRHFAASGRITTIMERESAKPLQRPAFALGSFAWAAAPRPIGLRYPHTALPGGRDATGLGRKACTAKITLDTPAAFL